LIELDGSKLFFVPADKPVWLSVLVSRERYVLSGDIDKER
jgi:hypothetical protein